MLPFAMTDSVYSSAFTVVSVTSTRELTIHDGTNALIINKTAVISDKVIYFFISASRLSHYYGKITAIFINVC